MGSSTRHSQAMFSCFLTMFLAVPTIAAEINSSSDASLTGATLIDFEAETVGSYATHSIGDATFTAQGGSGILYIANTLSGDYNTTGQYLDNHSGDAFSSLRIDFAGTASAVGFNWGASNEIWTLTAYNASGTVLETRGLPITGGSNLGEFYGLATPGTAYIILSHSGGDWILLDNFYYNLGAGPAFTSLPYTPNQTVIYNHLNEKLDSVSGEFQADLTILASLPDGQFQAALNALSPEPYTGLRDSGHRVVRAGSATVYEHLQGIMLANTEKIDSNQLVAATSTTMAKIDPSAIPTGKKGLNAWAKPYHYSADQNSKDDFFGYTHEFTGMSLGADYRVSDQLLVGMLVGLADGDVKYDEVNTKTDMTSQYVALYGAGLWQNIYLHGQIGYFSHDFDTQRELDFISRTASSSHDADEYNIVAGGEYLGWQANGWNLLPGLSFEYSYYDEEGFAETGAGSFNLSGDGNEDNSFASRLGLRCNKSYALTDMTFLPEIRAAWTHEFGDTDRDISTRFAGSGADTFTVTGVDLERDTFSAGLGMSFLTKTTAIFLNYDHEFASDYKNWGLTFGVKYSF